MRTIRLVARSALMFAMLAATALVSAQPAVGKYKVCIDPNRNRPVIACGENSCPGGTTYDRTVNKPIPECNGSCVDMRSLGWKNKGNKNDWCKARGYEGVYAYPGKYIKGGCCVLKSPEIVKPTDEALKAMGFTISEK